VSTATVWGLIIGCAVITIAIKAAGPIALGGRELPPWFGNVVALMAPALLAALVVTSALAEGKELTISPVTAGVAAAGLIVWRGGSVVLAVAVAAFVAGGLRAIA
jgi:branched-subunit amino acid transport protein